MLIFRPAVTLSRKVRNDCILLFSIIWTGGGRSPEDVSVRRKLGGDGAGGAC